MGTTVLMDYDIFFLPLPCVHGGIKKSSYRVVRMWVTVILITSSCKVPACLSLGTMYDNATTSHFFLSFFLDGTFILSAPEEVSLENGSGTNVSVGLKWVYTSQFSVLLGIFLKSILAMLVLS